MIVQEKEAKEDTPDSDEETVGLRLYCYIVILLYCHIVILLYCYIVILLYCYTVLLLYCYIVILFYCYIVCFSLRNSCVVILIESTYFSSAMWYLTCRKHSLIYVERACCFDILWFIHLNLDSLCFCFFLSFFLFLSFCHSVFYFLLSFFFLLSSSIFISYSLYVFFYYLFCFPVDLSPNFSVFLNFLPT